jgi:UDP-N-acetylglucosamine 2-epimerase (non-hydrolysing)
MEEGAVMLVGLKYERIAQGLDILINNSTNKNQIVSDYTALNVSDKVLKIIISYTDYINRVVWIKKI